MSTIGSDTLISEYTLRRKLVDANLRSRRPSRVPQLTKQHKTSSLVWVRDHINWRLPQWRNVFFPTIPGSD